MLVSSPFPGMNPFIEQAAHWQDFHTELLTTIRRSLTPQVGPNYILRDRLPVIPIPLRIEDTDARVDLQEALLSAYDAAGYERDIYEGTPEPALSPEDAAWAKQILSAV